MKGTLSRGFLFFSYLSSLCDFYDVEDDGGEGEDVNWYRACDDTNDAIVTSTVKIHYGVDDAGDNIDKGDVHGDLG